jgi:hypothetical protein
MLVAAETGLEAWPGGNEHEHTRFRDPAQDQLDQLQGGRIHPMRILDPQQHRLRGRKPGDLLHKDVQCSRPALLGREVERRIVRGGIQANQGSQELQSFGVVAHGGAQECLQFGEPLLGAVAGRQACGMAQVMNDRPEGTAYVVGRALVTHNRRGFICERIQGCLSNA